MLSEEQTRFYHENGYLMIENALSEDQLGLLQQITSAFIAQSRSVTQNNDVFDLDKGHCHDTPRLTRIKTQYKQHPAFWDVLASDGITAILKSLLGADIRLHNSKLNTRAPGCYAVAPCA